MIPLAALAAAAVFAAGFDHLVAVAAREYQPRHARPRTGN
jgi:hypothetical protein